MPENNTLVNFPKRILLLSPYDAVSHRYWHTGLVKAFPEIEWTVLALPPRYFSWRIRGNSLTLGMGYRDILLKPYDLIIATSMTDLSSLRGLVPELSKIPTIVYFHENQFVYPTQENIVDSVGAQIVTLYSALAADCVVFNTRYNQETFIVGAKKLLNQLPDGVPKNVISEIVRKSRVVPVPLQADHLFQVKSTVSEPKLQIVWNHRWEYDKAPERFFSAIAQLAAKTTSMCIHVVGQQFRSKPPCFAEFYQKYSGIVGQWGFIDSCKDYHQLLANSDVVVSTALHDFQGIAIQEAVAFGCIPVVPDRLAYPYLFSKEYCYQSNVDDIENETDGLVKRLYQLVVAKQENKFPQAPVMQKWYWSSLKEDYASLFSQVCSSLTKREL
ncbi:tRNA-queuosine alpha-mannosyltransferase domain-containing protein [Zooshikella sp. RANM57]|uniref:tRNA-queuosine alpha-mannosyltransferase domain-containing protein n=1 Tax=Zooshikella sp. RANM57 TaxID=3425863 RepID=UPI003D6FCB43